MSGRARGGSTRRVFGRRLIRLVFGDRRSPEISGTDRVDRADRADRLTRTDRVWPDPRHAGDDRAIAAAVVDSLTDVRFTAAMRDRVRAATTHRESVRDRLSPVFGGLAAAAVLVVVVNVGIVGLGGKTVHASSATTRREFAGDSMPPLIPTAGSLPGAAVVYNQEVHE